MTKEYMNNKFVESLVYDIEIQPEKYTIKRKLNIDFLKKLNSYLKNEKVIERLDSNVKNRIYMLLNYIRFDMNKNGNLMYNREINEAIRNLNDIEEGISIGYYLGQLNARIYKEKQTIYISDLKYLKEFYNNICYSISYDYRVLKNLRKTQEKYFQILPKYIGDEWFLASIKGIYYENKEIFEDEIFLENIYETIIQNQKSETIHNDIKKISQEIREKILKR